MVEQSGLIALVEEATPEGPGVVALSGGADSAVCAWALVASGRVVRSAFVDHGFPESGDLRRASADIARRLGLEHSELNVTVDEGGSPEDAARIARYGALLGELGNGEWLATGHTADDQAETVLGHMLRGSASDGLAGIPPRRGPIVRPLLGATRPDVRQLADELALPFVDDPTNLDQTRRRNQIRNVLIPSLERDFNPRLRAALTRTAAVLHDDVAVLEAEADKVPLKQVSGGLEISATLLAMMPIAITRRAVRRALRELHPPYAGSHDDVDGVLSVVLGGPPVTVSGGVHVWRNGPMVRLAVAKTWPAQEPVEWSLPGNVTFGGVVLAAHVSKGPLPARPLSAWQMALELAPGETEHRTLVVRTAALGEKMSFSGGHKDIRDAMAEAGIDASRRSSWPIVADGGHILWVPGVRRTELGWVEGASARYLWALATEET